MLCRHFGKEQFGHERCLLRHQALDVTDGKPYLLAVHLSEYDFGIILRDQQSRDRNDLHGSLTIGAALTFGSTPRKRWYAATTEG